MLINELFFPVDISIWGYEAPPTNVDSPMKPMCTARKSPPATSPIKSPEMKKVKQERPVPTSANSEAQLICIGFFYVCYVNFAYILKVISL